MHASWREEAAHLADLITGALKTLTFYPESFSSAPRKPRQLLGGWWDEFQKSLLVDKEFFAWANSHIIQQLNQIDPLSKGALEEVDKICERLDRLAARLRDGGKGSDLVWEIEREALCWPPTPLDLGQEVKNEVSKLTLSQRGLISDAIRSWEHVANSWSRSLSVAKNSSENQYPYDLQLKCRTELGTWLGKLKQITVSVREACETSGALWHTVEREACAPLGSCTDDDQMRIAVNRAEACLLSISQSINMIMVESKENDEKKSRPGVNPMRWNGAAKLALLRYLFNHSVVQHRKIIADKATKEGAGKTSSILANLVDLINAGWMSESKMGTCLNEKGIKKVKKKLGIS
jgi:hypothetical protein